MNLKAIFYLLRPHQWYKNALIFLGLLFSGNLFNLQLYPQFMIGFVVLCLISSVNYIINDLRDLEADRIHPLKRDRPLASSTVSIRQAIILILVIFPFSSYLAYLVDFEFVLVVLALFITSQIYSFWAKKIIIVDTIIIATDHVWRALAGIPLLSGSQYPPLSIWFIFGVFFIAMLLATGKRIAELKLDIDDASNIRKTLGEYTEKILEHQLSVISSTIVLFYSLYIISSQENHILMSITIPVVIYAILRYHYLLSSKKRDVGNPELLFLDRPIVASIIIWAALTVVIMYFF